jgi:hypothetical protein
MTQLHYSTFTSRPISLLACRRASASHRETSFISIGKYLVHSIKFEPFLIPSDLPDYMF